jgi:hypothetical protein
MFEWTSALQWWHWWIAALVLGIVEVLMPGAVAIWFACAAAVVGVLRLVVPMPWQLQFVLFAALSCGALVAWRRWKREHPETSALPRLNQRAAQYIGETCELAEPINDGYGKIRLGDGYWKVRGPTLPAGARVRVVAAEGALLVVEAT